MVRQILRTILNRLIKAEWYLCGNLAIVYPAHGGKVGWLSTVETMVEASMVAIREGDHKLASFLSNLAVYVWGGEREGERDLKKN